MGKFIDIATLIAATTEYKSIKSAFENGKLLIYYYPRDNMYQFIKFDVSDKTKELVYKEINRLYPEAKEIKN